MLSYWIVFLGAGLGGMMRHGVNILSLKWIGPEFPYGTLAVNILGSLVIGLLAGYFALKGEASQTTRLFLTTGVLGGFTTFSAFSLEALLLYEKGSLTAALSYILLSVGLSVVSVFLGLFLIRQIA